MRYAVKFAYDGAAFHGYQRQPRVRTVEGDILLALQKAGIIRNVEESNFQSSSRTDKGVSALGNVISFDSSFRKDGIVGAANAYLKDIWFWGIASVPDDFNPRFPVERWYRYHLPKDCNIQKIRKGAKLFLGEHDFKSFTKEKERTIKTINSIRVKKAEDFVLIDFKAQSFLWNMLRRIIFCLQKLEAGEMEEEDIKDALRGNKKDFGSADPGPLVLMDVAYGFDFEKRMGGEVKEILAKQRRGLQQRSKFFDYLLERIR